MAIVLTDHTEVTLSHQTAFRLINSKFPPIAIFDDVASEDEFEALYAVQQLTNPRLQNEAGKINLLPVEQIPFQISGCSYACAPFTHVNPDGSRFSDGSFGVLYLADTIETAIAEVHYHQQKNWQNIEGLQYDTIVMRGLNVNFSGQLVDVCNLDAPDIYHLQDYSAANILGAQVRKSGLQGLQYDSVRSPTAICWALMTPQHIHSVIQASHYEFIYDGSQISHIRLICAI